MADFSQLGTALGGLVAGDTSLQFAQGAHLGATTRDALAQAATREMEQRAKLEIARRAQAMGVDPAQAEMMGTAAQGGIPLNQPFEAARTGRTLLGDRMIADVNSSPAAIQHELAARATSPVKPFEPVGTHAYVSTLSPEAAPVPLGANSSQESKSALMQALHAYHLIDPVTGEIKPGHEWEAYEIQRNTEKLYDQGGGVMALHSANPYVKPPHTVFDQASAGPAPLGAALAPPTAPVAAPAVPVAAPAPLGAAIAPPARPVAAPAPVAPVAAPQPVAKPAVAPQPGGSRPLVPVDTVASNVAAVETAKAKAHKIGEGEGEATVALPDVKRQTASTLAQLDAFGKEPSFDTIYGPRVGAANDKLTAFAGGGDVANAMTALGQLRGNALLQGALQGKGVFSRITNLEAIALKNAYTQLIERQQTPEHARKALENLKVALAAALKSQIEKSGEASTAGNHGLW
jgi:hypothetical protein